MSTLGWIPLVVGVALIVWSMIDDRLGIGPVSVPPLNTRVARGAARLGGFLMLLLAVVLPYLLVLGTWEGKATYRRETTGQTYNIERLEIVPKIPPHMKIYYKNEGGPPDEFDGTYTLGGDVKFGSNNWRAEVHATWFRQAEGKVLRDSGDELATFPLHRLVTKEGH